jgi:predicted phosphodiesterase
MQVAIVSDIHGNRHAFEAVLEDIAAGPAVEVWCLGDVVGYGADPNDCCEIAREHCAVVLSGNHDLAVTGELSLEEFSRGAAIAARWTQDVLDSDHLEWLRGLRPTGEERDIGLFHASPRDPVWEYVLSTLLAELCLDVAPERVCLVGHSHVALSFERREGEAATGDTRRAVAEGLASSARTITSSALIMVAVFLVFALTGLPQVKEIGVGLAAAIFLDATVVRLILVPATMELMGSWNWWLPKSLDRILPHMDFESSGAPTPPAEPPEPALAAR